jgi:hypothetical protein
MLNNNKISKGTVVSIRFIFAAPRIIDKTSVEKGNWGGGGRGLGGGN